MDETVAVKYSFTEINGSGPSYDINETYTI